MPENIEKIQTPESKNAPETQRRLGAATLAAANFDTRHKEIVDSSFDKARENGEKLPGKNNERRNYAYLSRLENLIEKHGNEAETKLWEASVKDDLLIDYDNITESYWQSKRQELRDNGYGDIRLTDDYKHELFNKERELQKESLEKWANYLGDEHSPYPLWFKVYAWDGMTKMGKYDKAKGKYATRNETTVAPYPSPDAEVLGGVFEVINRYYGNNEKEFYTEEGERNIELEKVVQSGNFAKIYNAVQHDIAPIIEPPEKAEDVHGSWIEDGIGEEDDIARSARGTGWCVASPSVGRHYLEYGTYGNDNDWDEDDNWEDDEDDKKDSSLKSKFILFHLEDPFTGKLSKNAVASIRLDPDGQVAEISGLKEGQALEDSLVPIVEEKVKTLPGGEKFLEAFADKQELIRLDHKMQNDEDLTKDELEFIYEINRPINVLDTYNNYDPRVKELKQKYDVEYALDAGIDVNWFISELDSNDIARNLDILIKHGANIDIDNVISELASYDIVKNLDTLLGHNANVNMIVEKIGIGKSLEYQSQFSKYNIDLQPFIENLSTTEKLKNLDAIFSARLKVDINTLVKELDPINVLSHMTKLQLYGADIDIDEILKKDFVLKDSKIIRQLLDNDMPENRLANHMDIYAFLENLPLLTRSGRFTANDINERIKQQNMTGRERLLLDFLQSLAKAGADINIIADKFPSNMKSFVFDQYNLISQRLNSK